MAMASAEVTVRLLDYKEIKEIVDAARAVMQRWPDRTSAEDERLRCALADLSRNGQA